MPDNLLILLEKVTGEPSQYQLAASVLCSQTGQTPVDLDNQALQEAAKTAAGVMIIVPGTDVHLTSAMLPALPYTKLMKAIPYALEDQLTQPAGELHFAVSDTDENAELPIAVVSKDIMLAWQTVLQASLGDMYSRIKWMMPDILLMPYEENTVSIILHEDMAMVRDGKQGGFKIEKEELFNVLTLFLKKKTSQHDTDITIYGKQDELILTDEQIKKIQIPIHYKKAPDSLINLFADTLPEAAPLNLLQGDYAVKSNEYHKQKYIYIMGGIIGIWLVALTLIDITHYFLTQRKIAATNEKIERAYIALFPGQKLPENIKEYIGKQLSLLKKNAKDTTFLRIVSMAQQSIPAALLGEITFKEARYHQQELSLEVEMNDSSTFDKLVNSLNNQGLEVINKSAQRNKNNKIDAQLTIRETAL